MIEVFDTEKMILRVMDEKCSTCIFRPDASIVSKERLKSMLEDADADPDGMGHIPCHHTYNPSRRINKGAAVCRGWWDARKKKSFWAQIAERSGIVRFKKESDYPKFGDL